MHTARACLAACSLLSLALVSPSQCFVYNRREESHSDRDSCVNTREKTLGLVQSKPCPSTIQLPKVAQIMGDAGREVPLTAKLGGQAESAVKKKVQVRALAIAAGCRRGPGGGWFFVLPKFPSAPATARQIPCRIAAEREKRSENTDTSRRFPTHIRPRAWGCCLYPRDWRDLK